MWHVSRSPSRRSQMDFTIFARFLYIVCQDVLTTSQDVMTISQIVFITLPDTFGAFAHVIVKQKYRHWSIHKLIVEKCHTKLLSKNTNLHLLLSQSLDLLYTFDIYDWFLYFYMNYYVFCDILARKFQGFAR